MSWASERVPQLSEMHPCVILFSPHWTLPFLVIIFHFYPLLLITLLNSAKLRLLGNMFSTCGRSKIVKCHLNLRKTMTDWTDNQSSLTFSWIVCFRLLWCFGVSVLHHCPNITCRTESVFAAPECRRPKQCTLCWSVPSSVFRVCLDQLFLINSSLISESLLSH